MMKDELFVSPVCLEDEEDEEESPDTEEDLDDSENVPGDDSETENEYGNWDGDSE